MIVTYINSNNFKITGSPLPVRKLAGICLQTCHFLLRQYKLKLMSENEADDRITQINQFNVLISVQLDVVTIALFPSEHYMSFSSVNIDRMSVNSYPAPRANGLPFCVAENCLRIMERVCSCLTLKVMEAFVSTTFHYLKSCLLLGYEKRMVEQSLKKCLTSLNQMGLALGNCPNDDGHRYELTTVDIFYRINDSEGCQLVLEM